jgi:hypothetical protein
VPTGLFDHNSSQPQRARFWSGTPARYLVKEVTGEQNTQYKNQE